MFDYIKFDSRGLVPCITQEASTKEVLMLAYMNEEALKATLDSGYATYFSRSRRELWVKGKTSGNVQQVVSVKYDCDGDTILLTVNQTGPACHTGARTCFYNEMTPDAWASSSKSEPKSSDLERPAPGGVVKSEESPKSRPGVNALLKDYQTITDRKENPKEGSYTNYLFEKGVEKICKKVGEESSEIIIAAMKHNKQELIYEISDLMYHVSVLMADQEVIWDDIFQEIENRRK